MYQIAIPDINNKEEQYKRNKAKKFKKVITDKNDNILFWPFFEYMKNRTNDIPNIEW